MTDDDTLEDDISLASMFSFSSEENDEDNRVQISHFMNSGPDTDMGVNVVEMDSFTNLDTNIDESVGAIVPPLMELEMNIESFESQRFGNDAGTMESRIQDMVENVFQYYQHDMISGEPVVWDIPYVYPGTENNIELNQLNRNVNTTVFTPENQFQANTNYLDNSVPQTQNEYTFPFNSISRMVRKAGVTSATKNAISTIESITKIKIHEYMRQISHLMKQRHGSVITEEDIYNFFSLHETHVIPHE